MASNFMYQFPYYDVSIHDVIYVIKRLKEIELADFRECHACSSYLIEIP